jgi:hypothetical protein
MQKHFPAFQRTTAGLAPKAAPMQEIAAAMTSRSYIPGSSRFDYQISIIVAGPPLHRAILSCVNAAFSVIDAAFSWNDPAFVAIGAPDSAALHPGYSARRAALVSYSSRRPGHGCRRRGAKPRRCAQQRRYCQGF